MKKMKWIKDNELQTSDKFIYLFKYYIWMPSNTEIGDVSQYVIIYTFPKLLLQLAVDIFDLFFSIMNCGIYLNIYISDFSETLGFLLDTPNGKCKVLLCIYSPYLQVAF